MKILSELRDLNEICESNPRGILADTGFIYAVADADDRLNSKAIEVHEALQQLNVPIFANVISRLEFIDLILRKQLTLGAITVFETMSARGPRKVMFNLLKSIRDENTAHRRVGHSFKLSEKKLKMLKARMNEAEKGAWAKFCAQYAGDKLTNEWRILEEEFGLEFIEVLEGETSDIVDQALRWSDMVRIMGREGLRGPDAMISNLFIKSRLQVLITTDGDLVTSFPDEGVESDEKFIFHLH